MLLSKLCTADATENVETMLRDYIVRRLRKGIRFSDEHLDLTPVQAQKWVADFSNFHHMDTADSDKVHGPKKKATCCVSLYDQA